MPANLVPNDAIAELASRVDQGMLRILRRIEQAGFIRNSTEIDQDTADILQRLAHLGLIDPGYEGPTNGTPFLWVSNSNGSRVLRHIEKAIAPKIKLHPRARTALASLSERDQENVWAAVEGIVRRDPASWPTEEMVRLREDESLYLLRVSPALRAFISVLDSGGIELFDIMREETLRLFLERQRAAGAPQ